MTPFGKLSKTFRSRRGLYLADQAEALKVSVSTVSAYEVGTRVPSSDYAERLAKFLDLRDEEKERLLQTLAHSSNVIKFHPRDNRVASLAHGIARRLNELSPDEIRSLRTTLKIPEPHDV